MESVITLTEYTVLQKKNLCQDKQRAAGPDGVVGDPINVNDVLR